VEIEQAAFFNEELLSDSEEGGFVGRGHLDLEARHGKKGFESDKLQNSIDRW
jgi:hypothetical protein